MRHWTTKHKKVFYIIQVENFIAGLYDGSKTCYAIAAHVTNINSMLPFPENVPPNQSYSRELVL